MKKYIKQYLYWVDTYGEGKREDSDLFLVNSLNVLEGLVLLPFAILFSPFVLLANWLNK